MTTTNRQQQTDNNKSKVQTETHRVTAKRMSQGDKDQFPYADMQATAMTTATT